MKEINEKDLENVGGGFAGDGYHQIDGRTIHMGNHTCEKYEKKGNSVLPFNCCENCVHGERRSASKYEYACGLGM